MWQKDGDILWSRMSNILDILHQRQQKIQSPKDFLSLKFKSKHWRSKDIKAHFGCVNALAFSHNGQFLASGGDDRRILVWNVGKTLSKSVKNQKNNYQVLQGTHESNIFCLDFSCNLVSHKDIQSKGALITKSLICQKNCESLFTVQLNSVKLPSFWRIFFMFLIFRKISWNAICSFWQICNVIVNFIQ